MALNIFVRGFALGAAAGLRSMTAPATLLGAADSHWTGPARLAAAGELVVDKLPVTPSRIAPGPLAARVISGGLCGRTLARRDRESLALGTLAGVVGAIAGAYGGYFARRYLTTAKALPAFPIALLEDALAIALAAAATRA